MSQVAHLPVSPAEVLTRDAKKAHKAQVKVRVAMLRAEADLLERPSADRAREYELLRLDYLRARREWIQAEDKLREAQTA